MSTKDHHAGQDADFDSPELEQLQALARATDGLAPSAGFADAIMAAVEADDARSERPIRGGWDADVIRWGRSALAVAAVAAVAAAASALISMRAESALHDEILATVDLVEVVE